MNPIHELTSGLDEKKFSASRRHHALPNSCCSGFFHRVYSWSDLLGRSRSGKQHLDPYRRTHDSPSNAGTLNPTHSAELQDGGHPFQSTVQSSKREMEIL